MWYTEMIQRFPDQDSPEIFGLCPHSSFDVDALESNGLLDTILMYNSEYVLSHRNGDFLLE